jgi:hypothetical protein
VVGAQVGLEAGQGALLEGTGTVEVALALQDDGEVAAAVGGLVVVGA